MHIPWLVINDDDTEPGPKMQKLSLSLTTQLIRALKRESFQGVPTKATLDGYTVRVRGLDIFTGAPMPGKTPSIEIWYRSISHSAPFQVLDPLWPKSQWNMLQVALSQCLNVKPENDSHGSFLA